VPRLGDRVRVAVSGTPGAGAVTLSTALTAFQTFAAAGILNGDGVPYLIEDGANWEKGVGTYTTSGPTLTRTRVDLTSAGNTTPLTLTSSAVVSLVVGAQDLATYDIDRWFFL
jgi:hypothetical protein